MNKVNKWLIVLAVVLVLLVVLLGGYIVYDRMFSDDTKQEINSNEENNFSNYSEENNETLLNEDEAKEILKRLDEKFYPFYIALGPYCGEFVRDDYISFGSYENNDFRDYWASETFKTISELKTHLKSIMVLDLVPRYMDDGVSYIEKDGKLYCQLAHKGGGITRHYDVDAEYKINELTDSEISAEVVFCGQDMGEIECSDKNLVITIVKDSNGNWLVSYYKIFYN